MRRNVHVWFAGCFGWQVMFGENTTRKESDSPCSQERRLADIRFVPSYHSTWYIGVISVPREVVDIFAECEGRELQVWGWPDTGGFVKSPGVRIWDFCSRMQWWQLWAHSSSRRLSLIHQRLRWEELKTILANNSPPRRVLAGQPFAATWRGTWPEQMKTRSSMTWLSRPG